MAAQRLHGPAVRPLHASDGRALPFPRTVGFAVAAPLVALNLVDLLHGARLSDRWPRGWWRTQLAIDSTVALAVLWLFAFDATSALWALLTLPVLQAALRAQLRGALLTWAALGVGYAARDLWAAATYAHLSFYPDSVTFRLGILGIVAAATGSLSGRLTRTADRLATQVVAYEQALAEVDGLRHVAAATRQITSLDADVVLREVAAAATRVGFDAVRICVRDPNSSQWAPATAEGAVGDGCPGCAQLADAHGEVTTTVVHPVANGRVVVLVPVRSGDDVAALLLAEHADPVRPHHLEALDLLAAQARAALGNVRRYRERQQYEERLTRQALHDALTRLPNRVLLRDRINQALAASARSGAPLAVLLLDLDRFKEINDTLGHSYGDGLLVQVAERLSATLRGSDTAARLGGDEFALLAVDLADSHDARRVAERALAALHQPYVVVGLTLDVEASIGVAVAPLHGNNVDTLLRCADVAMYTAKAGKLGIADYDPAQDEHTPERLALLGDLRRALEVDDQLVLHFQPQVDVALGEVVGVEALLRWQHPARGLVPPGDFIPVAEGTGLIHKLTAYVLDAALAQARRWSDAGHAVPVAVNLSTRCLLDLGLPEQIDTLLARHDVPPHLLRLEITEGAIMADPTRALTVLQRLSGRGIRLSVDDFGTGYSSMSYLKRLPVDELKVDRSFVLDMQSQSSDAVLVRSVVELEHNLGLAVVAEGVEDADTLAALGEFGCDIAQGYHLARPMPAAALSEWLAGRRVDAVVDSGVGLAVGS